MLISKWCYNITDTNNQNITIQKFGIVKIIIFFYVFGKKYVFTKAAVILWNSTVSNLNIF